MKTIVILFCVVVLFSVLNKLTNLNLYEEDAFVVIHNTHHWTLDWAFRIILFVYGGPIR